VSAHYDVAIIGAGLVGCAAAFELGLKGRRVAVLDQGEVNRGASGRNAGSLHFQIEPRMLEEGVDPQRLAQQVPMNLRAIEDWRELPGRLRAGIELAMHGGLMVAETADERELLVRKWEVEARGGLPVRLVEGEELRRLAPYLAERVRCASYCAAEGHANPRLITPAYAAAARHLGGEIMTGARVGALEGRPEGWRIHFAWMRRQSGTAAASTLDAEAVLVAAGAWSAEILARIMRELRDSAANPVT
jgi:sarcosine oxidase subunit beta